jgi:glycosyltransferase involved in cell wall biosynthesis
MLKPLILSSRDIAGGAARATYRLHQALRQAGIDSKMLVQVKYGDDDSVFGDKPSAMRLYTELVPKLDKIPLKLYPQRRAVPFSPQWFPECTASKVARLAPDIINLHWINDGFLRIESLARLSKPIVWTMHDMWPFTGGCHYNEGCDHYTESCGACPTLASKRDKDLSRWIWNRKSRNWQELDITIVALSSWLADCARNSTLFSNLPIEVIPNCIDTNVYMPQDKHHARYLLDLPQDKKIVGFGALRATSDQRKGFHLLKSTLELLSNSNLSSDLELAVFGASRSNSTAALKAHYLGEIHDEMKLAAFYSAVDVFVLPSIEDNLPNTVMEALSCGTPCVAFRIGGIPDMIDHKLNGYLCRPFECQDLALGITWVIEDEERRKKLSGKAREKVLASYTQREMANQYLRLFEKLLP